jgi:tRNA(adenine34) deaminase
VNCPENLDQLQQDEFWMAYTLELAQQAEKNGEVPVASVVVAGQKLISSGINAPIELNDPTAHAEILALREAGQSIQNYRLCDTTLYVTLEPCSMCAGAIIHARVSRVVYAAKDPRTGAAGSVFNLLQNPLLNHQCEVTSGVLQNESADMLKAFFKRRRLEHKQSKA